MRREYKQEHIKYAKLSIGDRHFSKEGVEFEIIKITSVYRCDIKFLDEYSTLLNVTKESIKIGVKYPYYPSVIGVGYIGVGNFKSKENGKNSLAYQTWRDMLRRCYTESYKLKHPTYINVTVCEEWHNFQNFAEWFYNNYPSHIYNIKFQLDKDLLQQEVENKEYNYNTCVFLPQRINKFIATKMSNNTSGQTGVKLHKNLYRVDINDFDTCKNYYISTCKTLSLARDLYQKARAEQSEKAKQYLRNLNYLPEDIIELIK